MKQCIFCMKQKEDKEFNKEHIILEALGGKGDKDICLQVCTSCNSSLGTRVDASLLNHSIAKYMRYCLKIRGKNGVPNPFKGMEITYADTPVVGELKVNKEGKINGFRAKHQVIDYNGKRLIIGPRKGFAAYVNSELIKCNREPLTEKEILENKFDFGEPKIPHIASIEFPEEIRTQYLIYAFPTLLKMSYEYCFTMLGEKYLRDSVATDIRNFLMTYDYKKNTGYIVPTRASLKLEDDEKKEILLNMYTDNNNVWIKIILWGISADICMSESASEYKIVNHSIFQGTEKEIK